MKKNGIICAIDVNDFDQDVIDLAANFAKQFSVDLDLIHVTLSLDPTKAAWPGYLGSPDELIRDNKLFEQIDTSIKNVVVHRHHVSGSPVEKIVNFVDRNEPRLLILGTRARRGLSRILGSVAMKIMRKVSCPVMVLRQKQSGQASEVVATKEISD